MTILSLSYDPSTGRITGINMPSDPSLDNSIDHDFTSFTLDTEGQFTSIDIPNLLPFIQNKKVDMIGLTLVDCTQEEQDAATALTLEESINSLVDEIQTYIDDQARNLKYDSILSAATYSGSKNPKFKQEGLALAAYRDDVWTFCYALLAIWNPETTPLPTLEELIAEEEFPVLNIVYN